jgi:hypothetical protein
MPLGYFLKWYLGLNKHDESSLLIKSKSLTVLFVCELTTTEIVNLAEGRAKD